VERDDERGVDLKEGRMKEGLRTFHQCPGKNSRKGLLCWHDKVGYNFVSGDIYLQSKRGIEEGGSRSHEGEEKKEGVWTKPNGKKVASS